MLQVPGPGTHHIEKVKKHEKIKQPVFSMPKSHQRPRKRGPFSPFCGNPNPSPAAYKVQRKSRYKYNKCSMKSRQVRKVIKTLTGPGTYKPKTTQTKRRSSQQIFGYKGLRDQANPLHVPGPGKYNIRKKFGKKQKRKKRKKWSQSFSQQSKYSKDNAVNKHKKQLMQRLQKNMFKHGGFTKSDRPPLYLDPKTPGPGGYNLRSSFGRGKKFGQTAKFGSEERPMLKKPSKSQSFKGFVGPASYKLRTRIGIGQAHLYKGKPKLNDYSTEVPGPGSYIKDICSTKGFHYSVGHMKRPDISTCDRDVPGPDQYRLRADLLNIEAGKTYLLNGILLNIHSVGNGKRDSFYKEWNFPGPDHYFVSIDTKGHKPELRAPSTSITKCRANLTLIKMMRKTGGLAQQWNKRQTPAPNSYRIQESHWLLHNKKLQHSMAQSIRKKHLQTHEIAPGAYRTRKQLGGTKYSFGVSQDMRFKEEDEDDVLPGPGTYEAPTYTSTAPKYLFKQNCWLEED